MDVAAPLPGAAPALPPIDGTTPGDVALLLPGGPGLVLPLVGVGAHLQLGAAVLHAGDHLLQGGQHKEGAAAAAAQARVAAAGAAAVEAVVAAAQAVAAAVSGRAVRAAQAVVLANEGLSMMVILRVGDVVVSC